MEHGQEDILSFIQVATSVLMDCGELGFQKGHVWVLTIRNSNGSCLLMTRRLRVVGGYGLIDGFLLL